MFANLIIEVVVRVHSNSLANKLKFLEEPISKYAATIPTEKISIFKLS